MRDNLWVLNKHDIPFVCCINLSLIFSFTDISAKEPQVRIRRSFLTSWNMYESCQSGWFTIPVAYDFPSIYSSLFSQIKYVSGGYDSAEGFLSLNKEISEHELAKNSYGSSRRLFYLALPPSVYPSVCKMIRSYCMNQGSLCCCCYNAN